MKRLTTILIILLWVSTSFAQFPQISQQAFTANDPRFSKPINKSKNNELTIASFNIRNLAARQRSLKVFEQLVDLIDEADIVLIQEAGLGVYRGSTVTDSQLKRMKALTSVLSVYFGDGWMVVMAPNPSGVGSGTETTILAHKKKGQGYNIDVVWDGYIDLGDKRDMAVFKMTLSKNSASKDLFLASVHLTPDDPDRGQQMIKASDWLISQTSNQAIIMGDFNWGYKKKSGVENYLGEQRVKSLHEQEKLFQLFYELSYLGGSDESKLRTNMGFRKDGYLYDQFLMSPSLSGQMADGGELHKDCGILAFDIQSKVMKNAIIKATKKRSYGLERFIKRSDIDTTTYQLSYDKAKKDIVNQAANDATFIVSDHRLIWMQLKVW